MDKHTKCILFATLGIVGLVRPIHAFAQNSEATNRGFRSATVAWAALVDFAESSDPDALATAVVQAARASVLFEMGDVAADTSLTSIVEGTALIAAELAGDLIRMLRDNRRVPFEECRSLLTFAAIGWAQAYSGGNRIGVTGLSEPQLENRTCRR